MKDCNCKKCNLNQNNLIHNLWRMILIRQDRGEEADPQQIAVPC